MTATSSRTILLVLLAALLAAGCSSEEAAKDPGQEVIGERSDSDASVPLTAGGPSGSGGEEPVETVASLTAMLKDDSPEVRARAAQALGALGEPAKGAAAALTDLLADEDPMVRRQAVDALVALRPGPQVMIPILSKLLRDSDRGVQMRVLGALAEAGEAAVPGLVEALRNEEMTYWACLVLREIGPDAKAAVPALTDMLDDPRDDIRLQAVLALGAMNEAALPSAPQIAALVDDPHAGAAATFVLGQLGTIPADVEPAIRAKTESEDELLSTVSLWALARVHPDDQELRREATVKIVARLKSEDPHVRVAAARALAALPPAPEITVPIFEEALKDADVTTVHHALDALAALGEPAVPRLVAVLEREEKLRVEVIYTLGQIGPAAAGATDALAKLIHDEDLLVATEAAIALGKIGPAAKSAVPALCEALEKDGEINAHAIILALGNIGPDAAAAEPLVLKAMQSEDKALAVIAARTFMDIQPSPTAEAAAKAVAVLVAGLDDPLPETRKAAADSLGSLGASARDAIPALEKATKDAVKAVRNSAERALKSIHG